MRCPCEICVKAPICAGRDPCRRKEAYEKWKKRAGEIGRERKSNVSIFNK